MQLSPVSALAESGSREDQTLYVRHNWRRFTKDSETRGTSQRARFSSLWAGKTLPTSVLLLLLNEATR